MNEICALCKQIFKPSKTSTWIGPNNETIEVPDYDITLAEVEDVMICEACYLNGDADIRYVGSFDLHYQFGLEFLGKERPYKARMALEKAVAINAKPEALVSLANTYEGKSKVDLLIKALRSDPACELARLNLINEGLSPDEIINTN